MNIKDKYKIDCFYIDKNFKFYYMTFCNKCGKIILKDIKYQIENIKDNVLNDLYNILDDNKIEFIDFFNIYKPLLEQRNLLGSFVVNINS